MQKRFETALGPCEVQRLLGKGKSGYSYLAELNGRDVVLKRMHDEPCPYYDFGENNKVMLEVGAYHRLKACGIRLPDLLGYDEGGNYLVKAFIDGEVASAVIAAGRMNDEIVEQLFDMYHQVRKAGLNIDYFPANFVVREGRLTYIDYECNPFMAEWDLLNWGIYYWANSEGFREYLSGGDITTINQSPESGLPLKAPFAEIVAGWVAKFGRDG